jgi:hypothetical protein
MRLSSAIRAVLIALTLTVGFGTAAYADGGRIRFNVVKAGFVIGGSGVLKESYQSHQTSKPPFEI